MSYSLLYHATIFNHFVESCITLGYSLRFRSEQLRRLNECKVLSHLEFRQLFCQSCISFEVLIQRQVVLFISGGL